MTTPTTSGTVGQDRLTVIRFIEHATRRCGIHPDVLSAEMLISAKENLGLILLGLSTKGLTGWVYGKQVQPMIAGQQRYPLAAGTFQVDNALRRNATFNQGYISVDTITTVGIAFATPLSVAAADIYLTSSGNLVFALEQSFDAVNWYTVGQQSGFYTAGARVVVESNNTRTAPYWRVRELFNAATYGDTFFLTGINEVPLGRINKDDYTNLPDKGQLTTDPSTMWVDMQVESAQVVLWQAPDNSYRHLVVWGRRYVQDVGDYTDYVEVPLRWQDVIIFALACRIFIELPKDIVKTVPDGMSRLTYLEAQAAKMLTEASGSESDGSPVRLTPRLRGYTR